MSKSKLFRAVYLESKARLAEGKGDDRDDALVSFYDQTVYATANADKANKQVVKALGECNELNRRLGVANAERDAAQSQVRMLTNGKIELTEEEQDAIEREIRTAARH